MRFVYAIFKLAPVQRKVTLISRQSDSITLDFGLIRERADELLPEYRLRVLTKKVRLTPLGVAAYGFHMLRQMYHIATSEVVLLDSYCVPVSLLRHRKSLTVIQMWHAMGLMKTAGKSALGKEEGRDPSLAKLLHMHDGYDYIFASSEICKEPISKVFGYTVDHMVVMPLPTVDLLRDEARRRQTVAMIREKYGLTPDKKVILYAPTFRKDERGLQAKIDELTAAADFDRYHLFIKLHPLSTAFSKDERAIVDKEFYSVEIAMASDFVITDYSSIIYEILILGKPLFFYAFDLDEYKVNRGFFIDFEKEAPGSLYSEGAGLMGAIDSACFDLSAQKAFLEKYVELPEGSVVEKLADMIRSCGKSVV